MRKSPLLCLAATLLLACSQAEPEYQRSIYTFGTVASITLYDLPRKQAVETANALEHALARLNRDWYAWGDGELGALNRSLANGTRFSISNELAQLLTKALEFRDASAGLFNPAVGELVELWGFHDDQTPTAKPASEKVKTLGGNNMSVRIQYENQQYWVETQRPGIIVDLGGIAKGAALAVCRDILQAHAVDRALIDLGGDLIALRGDSDPPFLIGVKNPRGTGVVAILGADGGEAVVTSGDYERYFDQSDERYHHIIDPKTGFPSVTAAAVTVIDNDPVRADAAATALMVGGSARFGELVTTLNIRYASLITSDGNVLNTSAMQQRMTENSAVQNSQ